MILSRILAIACCLLLPAMAQAQSLNIDLGGAGGAGATGRLVQITALVTVLSLAPSLLVMVTAFTRIVIVLSLLRASTNASFPLTFIFRICRTWPFTRRPLMLSTSNCPFPLFNKMVP